MEFLSFGLSFQRRGSVLGSGIVLTDDDTCFREGIFSIARNSSPSGKEHHIECLKADGQIESE